MVYNVFANDSFDSSIDNKGLYPVIIYEIITRHSSEKNKLTVGDLIDSLMSFWQRDKLQDEINIESLKRTILRNLTLLANFDLKIKIELKNKVYYDSFSDTNLSLGKIENIWYEQTLNEHDLWLLSDSLIHSNQLSSENTKDIIEKLLSVSGWSNVQNKTWASNILQDKEHLSEITTDNLYSNIRIINQAIVEKVCICFTDNFLFPVAKQIPIRKYKGISPYKIVSKNGCYYLIATAMHTNPELYDIYADKKQPFPIIRVAIHKLTDVAIDTDNPYYIDVKTTTGIEKNIKDFVGAEINPYNRHLAFKRFSDDIQLNVSSRVLSELTDLYGSRMQVLKTNETFPRYLGNIPELSYFYNVKIRHVTQNDWNRLVPFLLKYSSQEIRITGSAPYLKTLYEVLKQQLTDNIDQ